MAKAWFSYDPEDGFEFHDTAEEAKTRAEKSLEYAKDYASDSGWDDSEHYICWGNVREQVAVTSRRPIDPELRHEKQFSEMVEKGLVLVEIEAPPVDASALCILCAYEKPWGVWDPKTGVSVCKECRDAVRGVVN